MSIWILNQSKKEIAQVRERLGLTPYQFSTVEDMKLSTVLNNGDICITFGDEIVGDSLNKVFKIVSSEDQVPDGITEYTTLDSGQIAYLFSFFSKGDEATTIVLSSLIPLNMNTALNSETILSYKFSMLSSGSGTVKYYVDSILKATNIISTGKIYFDISPYITTTGNHVVEVVVSNTSGGSASLTYVINVISLSITSIFNDSEFYTGDITFRYTPYGAFEKTIHFKIDGNEISTATVTASGVQQTQLISALSHGAHILEVYSVASVGGVTITSNTLRYVIISYETGNNNIIIAADFITTSTVEGTILNIPYRVYNPAALTTATELYINEELKSSLIVDRNLHYWNLLQYPTGSVSFTIKAGTNTKSFTVQVEQSEVQVQPVTEDMELYLTSAGRSNYESVDKDKWVYEDVISTLTDFNWLSNGWILNEEGEVVLRVTGDARVNIPYKLFQNDARNNGMTLEVEFKSLNVNDMDTTLLSCVESNIGLKITPQKVTFSSELMNETLGSAIVNDYKDNEKIRVSFVVEPRIANKLIYVYINGVCSGITQYDDVDNFTQSSPVDITIGSNDAGIDLLTIRKYDVALTSQQILNNYIADTNLMYKKVALYNKNNIFDAYSNVDYSEIINRIPCLTIIGDLPLVKGDKKKVSIIYENRQDPERNIPLTSDIGIDVQGTSSQYYPRKNYKLKFPMTYLLRGELESKPEKVFTFKADYMESSHAYNTGNARIINGMMKETAPIPPQETDPLIRTTIDGFPCVIFHRTDVDSPLECMGAYNFNYDKDCPDTFGQKDGVECWEFCDNSAPRCNFLTWDHERLVSSDFEARYPDLDADDPEATVNLQRVIEWTASCNGDVQKFKNEVADYWILPGLLAYYCIAITLGMTDSMAKNLFIESFDGNHWYPIFYDMDTAYGLNNEGVVAFDYGIEFKDAYGESGHAFNGHQSVLWSMLELAFPDEIKQMYKDLRSNGLDYNSIVDIFINKQIDPIPEALYNYDANFKYLQPLYNEGIGTYLYLAQGTREHHFKWWLDNRFSYLDSKYMGNEYMDDYATMRLYTPTGTLPVPANGAFTLTSAVDQYLTIKFGAEIVAVRSTKGTPTLITPISSGFNDTETIIYGASNIAEIGELANKYAGTVDMSKATRLTKLIIGSSVAGYKNTNLHGLFLGNNTLLRELNVVNCTNLGGTLNINGCLGIEKVYATNTAITSVLLPVGGNLKILKLPATIVNLSILNHAAITDLTLQGYTNLTALRIENCPTVDILDIMTRATNLQRVRLIGVDLIVDDETFLENLKAYKGINENGNFTDSAVITGHIHINATGENTVNALRLYYPDLEITCTTYLEEYTVTFVNYDGTVLEEQYVIEGGSATNPVTRTVNPIATPIKPSIPQYSYTFASWSGTYSAVYSDRAITATFSQTVRSYDVRFMNGDQVLQVVSVLYGNSAVFSGEYPTPPAGHVFGEWNPSPINITGSLDCYATFDALLPPDEPKEFADYTWAEIKSLASMPNLEAVVDPFDGVKHLAEVIEDEYMYRYDNTYIHTSLGPSASNLAIFDDSFGVIVDKYAFTLCIFDFDNELASYKYHSLYEKQKVAAFLSRRLILFATSTGYIIVEVNEEATGYTIKETVTTNKLANRLEVSPSGDYVIFSGSDWAEIYSINNNSITFVTEFYQDNEETPFSSINKIRFINNNKFIICGGTTQGYLKMYSYNSEDGVHYICDADIGDRLPTTEFVINKKLGVIFGGPSSNANWNAWKIEENEISFIKEIESIDIGGTALRAAGINQVDQTILMTFSQPSIRAYRLIDEENLIFSSYTFNSRMSNASTLTIFNNGVVYSSGGAASDNGKLIRPEKYNKYIPWVSTGDTKQIHLNTGEVVDIQVMDFYTNNKTGTTDKAIFTLGSNALNITSVYNSSLTNAGGWHSSLLRSYMNNDLFNLLPIGFSLFLESVEVLTEEGSKSPIIITDNDKLFALSTAEVGGSTGTFVIFSNSNSRIRNSRNWWLRTPDIGTTNSASAVNTVGNIVQYSVMTPLSIVFGCCF